MTQHAEADAVVFLFPSGHDAIRVSGDEGTETRKPYLIWETGAVVRIGCLFFITIDIMFNP